ncbi:MAG: RNA polymerase sigma factor [Nitrospiraceae bacterium]|nr:RNA polymerase sigma factor [Nitrospiraceae bacterium]
MNGDIRFIEEYLEGDDEAGGELVMRYQRRIFAFLYRMTGDMEESKDLTQTVFIKALNGLKDFRKESSFKTWLYRIAANAGLNHISGRRQEAEIDETLASGEKGALSELMDNEKREIIRTGLDRLPERQRTAVILRVYEGLSCNETALVMGCTEGAVKAHYSFAVKKLKGVFREKGYDVKS